MNSINVTDKERDWIHVALVSKASEVRKYAEKYPSPETLRHAENVEELRDRFASMNEDEYYHDDRVGRGRGDREDFHSDG